MLSPGILGRQYCATLPMQTLGVELQRVVRGCSPVVAASATDRK